MEYLEFTEMVIFHNHLYILKFLFLAIRRYTDFSEDGIVTTVILPVVRRHISTPVQTIFGGVIKTS